MKILAIQNRMGIGDTVIFLPFIKAISEKFNSPISLLVKESSRANQYLYDTDYINEIIILDRNKNLKGRHDGILGSLSYAPGAMAGYVLSAVDGNGLAEWSTVTSLAVGSINNMTGNITVVGNSGISISDNNLDTLTIFKLLKKFLLSFGLFFSN